jgi:ribokinase
VSNVHIDPDAPTGTALITVAADGANTIVTSGGANHRVGRHELDALRAALEGARVLLIQLEIPIEVVADAVALANDAGVVVVLDPAPVLPLPADLLANVGWITPNVTEAQALTGTAEPRAAARVLCDRGVRNAVVTDGAAGCVYVGDAGALEVPAPEVVAVDTVACGDAFNGALAAELVRGAPADDALRIACAAGALAATRRGAASSLPRREEVPRTRS